MKFISGAALASVPAIAALALVTPSAKATPGPTSVPAAPAQGAPAEGSLCSLPAASPARIAAATGDAVDQSASRARLEAARGRTDAAGSAQFHTSSDGPAVGVHPYTGIKIAGNKGIDGACATQRITDVKVSDVGTEFFSPTLFAPHGCIEVTTVTRKGTRFIGAYNWCPAKGEYYAYAKSMPIDATFMSTYTDGQSNYTTRIYRTDAASNAWVSELYNYSTKKWDLLWAKSGVEKTGLNFGWDIDEMWAQGFRPKTACTDRAGKTFESSGISVRSGSSWSLVTPDNSSKLRSSWGSCTEPTLEFVVANSHWRSTSA